MANVVLYSDEGEEKEVVNFSKEHKELLKQGLKSWKETKKKTAKK